MRLLFVFILLMFVLVWVTPAFAADVAAGKELYGRKCASCHGVSGEGKETIAKTLKVEFRHLGSKEVQSKSDADLKKVITDGQNKMKPVKDVDAKGAEDVVAYLRTLKK